MGSWDAKAGPSFISHYSGKQQTHTHTHTHTHTDTHTVCTLITRQSLGRSIGPDWEEQRETERRKV